MAEKENRPKKKKLKKPIRANEPLDLSTMTELFMCTRCTKTYRLRHSLTRHLKFECGKEPKYACNLCDRKFKHKYDLNVHEKGKHGMIHVGNVKTENGEKHVSNHVDNTKPENAERNNVPVVLGNILEREIQNRNIANNVDSLNFPAALGAKI